MKRAIAQTILQDVDDDDADDGGDHKDNDKYQDLEILNWSGIWEGPIWFETKQCKTMLAQQGLGQGRVDIWNIDSCRPGHTQFSSL